MHTAPVDAAQEYLAKCHDNGLQPSSTVTIALREHSSSVFAEGHAIAPLLAVVNAGLAPFLRTVKLKMADTLHTAQIANFLQRNKHVEALDLSGSSLGDTGVLACFISIRNAQAVSPLASLQIADVDLSTEGAFSLAKILQENKLGALRDINLTRNTIAHTGLVALRSAAASAGISISLAGNLRTVERLNAITHGVGAAVAVWGGWRMLNRALEIDVSRGVAASVTVFAMSLCTMMLCSCLYHASYRSLELNKKLRKADHCGVFLLIAGTYTPFCVGYTRDTIAGPLTLASVWLCALIGLSISVGLVKASTRTRALFALLMGWIGIVPARLLYERMQPEALAMVFAGGVTYSLGLIFYFLGKKKDPMMHVVWHLAVMLGGTIHYVALWRYMLIPTPLLAAVTGESIS